MIPSNHAIVEFHGKFIALFNVSDGSKYEWGNYTPEIILVDISHMKITKTATQRF